MLHAHTFGAKAVKATKGPIYTSWPDLTEIVLHAHIFGAKAIKALLRFAHSEAAFLLLSPVFFLLSLLNCTEKMENKETLTALIVL